MWNSRTSWPVGAGHPCLGCTERQFWDTMTPFYGRLPDVGGFAVERYADTIGAALAAGAVAGVAAHAIATGVHQMRQRRNESTGEPNAQGGKGDGHGGQ
jgi:hydrogenase small subunit